MKSITITKESNASFTRVSGTRWLNNAEIYKLVSRRKSWNVKVCNNFDFVVKVEQEVGEHN